MNKKNIGLLMLIILVGIAGYFIVIKKNQNYQLQQTQELKVEDNDEQEKELLGGDRDEHGCIGSAGYSWCEEKKKCLRIWEEPCVADDVDLETIQSQIKTQLITKYGKTAETMMVSINQVEGDYATGRARDEESMGGGGTWFAVMIDGTWKLVWDGRNGDISCESLESYPNFSAEMIPSCLDENTGELKQRYLLFYP